MVVVFVSFKKSRAVCFDDRVTHAHLARRELPFAKKCQDRAREYVVGAKEIEITSAKIDIIVLQLNSLLETARGKTEASAQDTGFISTKSFANPSAFDLRYRSFIAGLAR